MLCIVWYLVSDVACASLEGEELPQTWLQLKQVVKEQYAGFPDLVLCASWLHLARDEAPPTHAHAVLVHCLHILTTEGIAVTGNVQFVTKLCRAAQIDPMLCTHELQMA